MKTLSILILTSIFFMNCSFLGKNRGFAITMEILTPGASDSAIHKTLSILKKRQEYCDVKSRISLSGDKKSIQIILNRVSDTSLCKEFLLRPGKLSIQETYLASDILAVYLEINSLLNQDSTAYPFAIPAFTESKKEFAPLDRILMFPFSYSGNLLEDASVGFAKSKDTALLNTIFTYPKFAVKFPSDLRLKWSRFPENNWHTLIAIKESSTSRKITEDMILKAQPADNNGYYQVSFRLKDDYHTLWAAITRDNTGKFLAFILDNEVLSFPMVVSEIPEGRGGIAGNMTKKEVNALASVLNYGPLPIDTRIR